MYPENISSMMTFKEYYNYFMVVNETTDNKETHNNKDQNQVNDWGQFVDLELNNTTNTNNIFKRNKSSKYISIPETIKEFPSINSFKSIQNLDDSLMIFEMDDYKNNKNKPNVNYLCSNVCGFIALILCCVISFR